MSNELIQVPFHGDMIEAMQDERGVWVPLRRPCESLGLDPASQARRLKDKTWANAVMMTVLDSAGRKFEMLTLHLDSFPMWLATIETRRVKEEMRPKLELYQKEAARVLAEHFLGRRQAAQGMHTDGLRQILSDAVPLIVDQVVGEMRSLLADMRQVQAEPEFTIKDRLEILGWTSCSTRRRDQIRNLALVKLARAGFPRPRRESPSPAAELLFPAAQAYLLDEAIEQIWNEVRRAEKGGLFEQS